MHAAADWVALSVWPAIVAVAERDPALFVAAESVTVPLPVPDAPLVTLNHVVSFEVAVHEHQLPVVTATVPFPPLAENDCDVGVIE